MSIILGLNAYHGDAAACVIGHGILVAAAEEERFGRIKHWAGFPAEAIRSCLTQARVSPAEIDHVALNQDSRMHRGKKLAYIFSGGPTIKLLLNKVLNRRRRASVLAELTSAF